ncbi:hypothetical protein [Streptomyces sp. S186]|uniref:hypothetical protein n=1 Tax=Streptomyces sp. S186 TaxID=3434395 RepID=UPI003F679FEC
MKGLVRGAICADAGRFRQWHKASSPVVCAGPPQAFDDADMYLVQARLRGAADAMLPPDVAARITRHAEAGTGLEHVTVHPEDKGEAVLGLFLVAASAEAAESAAWEICVRTLAGTPELDAFCLKSCRVSVPVVCLEWLLRDDDRLG